MGVNSRACVGCLEAFEQWQGLAPTVTASMTTTLRSTLGSISDNTGSKLNGGGIKKTATTGHLPDGLLGSNSSSETLGREDIVRLPKTVSDNIAIKTQPVK
ncbi:hypothetical protein BGW38_007893, partial [Lunasporangiospora selenospora]